MELRAATVEDADAIADIWHRGWHDGHAGNVPEAMYKYRQAEHFHTLANSRIAITTVAVIDDRIAGFVTVHDDEVEQVYVDASARGSGVADAILSHGERTVAETYDVAWLAVVAGNARARRFYERSGWADTGSFEYSAETEDGPFTAPVRRYEKRLR
ncbi:GNAT superfamily N-acetyltransferase [Aeromicrobium panaciterrae]|uniref:GNAT superfamily N-acetyltransferase n=1 Tax=Aeromicrobium panaciterrae TaxID=363861 RepID=A0ABU1UN42_9ACTN|nr:GNAT family N-acetyltransferase [Aeromicrobium panaciterrae]MDR7086610.1 GNAT superfamily N-acetyltransferase [Aeromicrobium panaciterrae]